MSMLSGFLFRDLRGASRARSIWVFCACLLLGIALISSCASLLQLIRGGFSEQAKHLFGGDLQVSQRQAITPDQLAWLNDNGTVSLLLELRTMMGTEAGDFTVVELQSVDELYPLYGSVLLAPEMSLQEAVAQSEDGIWGAAVDPVLMQTLTLSVGQKIYLGDIEVEIRANIIEQPDRSLRADTRGPPVVIDEKALYASGLVQPTSLIDFDYRVRIDEDPFVWRDKLQKQYPDATWEVQTVSERGEFVGRRLDQVASVLLLIGFSTLLIGGLGVANSIGAYLQTKLQTMATLQSLGAKEHQVATVYIGQTIVIATLSSLAGALLGATVAWQAAQALSERLPITPDLQALATPTIMAVVLGVCTSLIFTIPTLGEKLNMPLAQQLGGNDISNGELPGGYRWATAALTIVSMLLLLLFIPEPLIAVGFIISIAALLVVLQALVKLIRLYAERLAHSEHLDGHFVSRMAVMALYRPGASLRPMLLSLGTALTLLVAASLIIAATYNTLSNSVPARAPSLVFYDLQKGQVGDFNSIVEQIEGYETHVVAPLVLGKLTTVNGEQLSDSSITSRALEANDEHKLSYRLQGIDNTEVVEGDWWPEDYSGPTLVAMEDREANQLQLQVGDQLTFSILDGTVNATLAAIYSQARFETSFWLEAVFSGQSLEPYITRYIGSVSVQQGMDINAQSRLGEAFPGVVTIRTDKVLQSTRSILNNAGIALMVIAAVSLIASVLVMASVVAVNRQRQVYEASVLHAIGTRISTILKSVILEYLLLAVVLSTFAFLLGGALAHALLHYWLKIDGGGTYWTGIVVAVGSSSLCLFAGALWLVSTLRITPASLLKRGSQ